MVDPRWPKRQGLRYHYFIFPTEERNVFFLQHVALCPWFADTGILDGLDKSLIKKQVKLDFVTVERVGEAFEQVVKDQRYLIHLKKETKLSHYSSRSGSLMMIMPGCPLTYFPDVTMHLFFLTFLLSK